MSAGSHWEGIGDILASAGLLVLPVDIVGLAAQVGLTVITWWECPAAISGMLYRGPYVAEIIVNARHGLTRQRFTVAHELAHSLLGHQGRCLLLGECAETLFERDASALGAQLLMPDARVRQEAACQGSFTDLCARFAVSKRAMHLRLAELGLHFEGARR